MTAIAHPLRDSADWGRVLIGGSVLPGKLTEIVVPARVFNWAAQKGYGLSNITVFQNVDVLSGITFTHFLDLKTTGADDWTLLETFLKTLLPKWPTNIQVKPKSLPVIHPAIQFLGGNRVHLAKFYAPEPPSGEKIPQYYKIEFQEDIPDARPKTGPSEPAQLNGVPSPKDQADLANLTALAAFKGISVQQLLAKPQSTTSPAAVATGKAAK